MLEIRTQGFWDRFENALIQRIPDDEDAERVWMMFIDRVSPRVRRHLASLPRLDGCEGAKDLNSRVVSVHVRVIINDDIKNAAEWFRLDRLIEIDYMVDFECGESLTIEESIGGLGDAAPDLVKMRIAEVHDERKRQREEEGQEVEGTTYLFPSRRDRLPDIRKAENHSIQGAIGVSRHDQL